VGDGPFWLRWRSQDDWALSPAKPGLAWGPKGDNRLAFATKAEAVAWRKRMKYTRKAVAIVRPKRRAAGPAPTIGKAPPAYDPSRVTVAMWWDNEHVSVYADGKYIAEKVKLSWFGPRAPLAELARWATSDALDRECIYAFLRLGRTRAYAAALAILRVAAAAAPGDGEGRAK
jgi:hypothetical protein